MLWTPSCPRLEIHGSLLRIHDLVLAEALCSGLIYLGWLAKRHSSILRFLNLKGGRPTAFVFQTAVLNSPGGHHETLRGWTDYCFLCCHKTEAPLRDAATLGMDKLADVPETVAFAKA